MKTTIAPLTAIVILLAVAPSCSTRPAAIPPAKLTFVIDNIGEEEWSHFDDGSFEVLQTVTVRVTAPDELRGQVVKVRINPLADLSAVPSVGSAWSVPLPPATADEEQLQTLVYERLTQTPRGG